MSAEFAVGKRVVCIDDVYRGTNPGFVLATKGSVYTIREIVTLPQHVALRLEEIRNPTTRGWLWTDGVGAYDDEYCFNSRRFRPVRDTDISVFTKLLETPPIRQTVPA